MVLVNSCWRTKTVRLSMCSGKPSAPHCPRKWFVTSFS